MATTLTIEIDDQLCHAMLMAKSCYLHENVLNAPLEFHHYRLANYQRLQALFDQIYAALQAAGAAEAAAAALPLFETEAA